MYFYKSMRIIGAVGDDNVQVLRFKRAPKGGGGLGGALGSGVASGAASVWAGLLASSLLGQGGK